MHLMHLTIAFISLLFLAAIMNWKEDIKNFFERINLPSIDYIGDRILVIVPHPDDETIGTAGIIQRAIKLKKPILLIVVTSGEAYKKAAIAFFKKAKLTSEDYYKFGLKRQQETINAMELLGLRRENIIFLGFSDGTMKFLWSQNWSKNFPKVSSTTKVNYVPYDTAYKKGISYTGQSVVEVLSEIIDNFKPTDIYYPVSDDMHPDHSAVHNFVKYVILSKNLNLNEHQFLVHHPEWPVPWGSDINKAMLPPTDMVKSNTTWESFVLEKDEILTKHSAILKYKTQTEMMKPFLMAFIRKTELFCKKPIIIIPTLDNMPDLETYINKNPILRLYAGGVLEEEIYKSAALTRFSAFKFKDTLYLGIESAKPISKKVLYRFEMRFFDKDDNIKRIDFGIINEVFNQYKFSENSLIESYTDKPIIYKNKMWVPVRIPDVKTLKYIFIGVDSIYKNKFIDKIPWNIYKIKNN
ncbi:MAG: PIG-L deacetylase family protein [Thermoanaerobacteraceae bacterium]